MFPNEDTKQSDVPFHARTPLSAVGRLSINGQAEGEAQFTNVNVSSGETLDIGSDLGSPVSPDYKTPNRFSGTITIFRSIYISHSGGFVVLNPSE